VAEHPLARLGRVVGGVVLMPGRLGHQVLGQLLLSGSTDVAIAAASVAVAAATRQRDVVTQVAVSTVVPALAVRSLLQKKEDRLKQLADSIAARDAQLAAREENLARREAAIRRPDQPDMQARIRSLLDRVSRLTEDLEYSERRRRLWRRRS
jgi:hypothetical protein